MPSPGKLIDVISEVSGVEHAKVFSTHRYLREAGLVTQGGRGTSAAKMTYLDAARILVALAANGNVKDSAALVETYGGLLNDSPLEFEGEGVRGLTLADAIAVFLELLPTMPANTDWSGPEMDGEASGVEVRLAGPRARASIKYKLLHHKGEMRFFGAGRSHMADMTFETIFTHTTLGHVGRQIAG